MIMAKENEIKRCLLEFNRKLFLVRIEKKASERRKIIDSIVNEDINELKSLLGFDEKSD
jgi:hypothetical protein